jgi:hypothetical protein
MAQRRWLVYDMDAGALRWEPTRRAAVAWMMARADADTVFDRWSYGDAGGKYEYSVGRASEPDDRVGYFVWRADVVPREGVAGLDRPLYPYPDRPDEVDPAVEAELDAGLTRRWGSPARLSWLG